MFKKKFSNQRFFFIHAFVIRGTKYRVMAMVDPDDFRLALLNDEHTVRLQRCVSGMHYETIKEFDSLAICETEVNRIIEEDAAIPQVDLFDIGAQEEPSVVQRIVNEAVNAGMTAEEAESVASCYDVELFDNETDGMLVNHLCSTIREHGISDDGLGMMIGKSYVIVSRMIAE